MPKQEAKFKKAIRKLKPPSSLGFNLEKWKAELDKVGHSEENEQLLNAAILISSEVKAIENLRPADLDILSPKWSSVLAVAACNREYRTASEIAWENAAIASKDRGIGSLDALAATPVFTAGNQSVSIASIAEIVTDQTENWLFDAAKSVGTSGEGRRDLADVAVSAIGYYNLRKSMSSLWNQVLYDEVVFELGADDRGNWKPKDVEYETLKFAWRAREEANASNLPFLMKADIWPKMKPIQRRRVARKKSVRSIQADGRLKVSRIAYLSNKLPEYMAEKYALIGSYTEDFIESDFPNLPGCTVEKLLEVWHLLRDVAEYQCTKVALPDGKITSEDAQSLAIVVGKSKVIDAIADAMTVSHSLAREMLQFLTFEFQGGMSKGNKGLWASPVVAVPETEDICLVLPVLQTSNVLRRVECWLEKGGIDDSNPLGNRGEVYEKIYREKISSAISQNTLFETAVNANNGISKSDEFDEQIDLLVSFGGLYLVGEIKFFLMPIDPHECKRYEDKLFDAAEQIKRKLEKLKKRPDIVSRALKIPEEKEPNLYPVIITNRGFGFSKFYNGVLVVDARFFKTYFDCSGEIISDMAFQDRRNAKNYKVLYESEKQAASLFVRTMSSPYVLNRFVDRVSWRSNPVVSVAGYKWFTMTPFLSDVPELLKFNLNQKLGRGLM